jgi:hypothetical protein
MSNKTKLIKDLYLKNFRELLQDLGRIYPNDNTLKLCIISFNTFSSIKPDYVINEAIFYLSPYKEKILARDEDFLLSEIEKDFSQEEHGWIAGEMKRVKEIWRSEETSKETKEKIWQYLVNFIKLGDKLQTQ